MRLKEIEIFGFRGVKGHVRINVPSGFLVVVGRNGSGKSTICDAIEYALSGTIRQTVHKEKGESYSDYVWWRGRGKAEKHCVKLTFEFDDGHSIIIERDASGLTVDSEKHLHSFYDNANAPESPISSMCRTSIIRDEEITSLSIDLPESERYRFVKDALGNVTANDVEQRIDAVKDLLQKRAKDFQADYDRCREKVADLTSRLSDTQATITATSGSMYSTEDLCRIFVASTGETPMLLQAGRQMASKLRLQMDQTHSLFTTIQSLESTLKEVSSKEFVELAESLEIQLVSLKNTMSEVSEQHASSSKKVSDLRKSDPNRALFVDLIESGEKLGLTSNGTCPLCGSLVTDASFESHVAQARVGLELQHSESLRQIAEEKDLSQKKAELEKSYDDLSRQIAAHRSTKEQVQRRFVDATKTASELGIFSASDLIKLGEVQEFLEQTRIRLSEVEKAVAWIESSSLVEIVETLKEELNAANQHSKASSERLSRSEDALRKTNDAMKGVRSVVGEVIDEQLAELSPLIEELYKRLRPHVEWTQLRYKLRGDVRRMLSFEVGDGLNPSFLFSSGQRRAAGLSFLLAVHLSRLWCKWNTLFLDDPVQHVDDYRALNLIEVLAAIRKTGKQVIVSVEDEALAQMIGRRLRCDNQPAGALVRMHYDREIGVVVEATTNFHALRRDILVPA